ncbi:MAG: hypothetical protein LBS28_03465 [Streptococcaceae bacterium]|nr:hypothetical protein [Streptococcaceae bacterium]
MKKFKNIFKLSTISFILIINFVIFQPHTVNAAPLTEFDRFIEIKNFFRDSGYVYEKYQHNPQILKDQRRGNCVAFAMRFQSRAQKKGLTSKTIVYPGHAYSPGHAYNLVRIDGQWYYVDFCNYTSNYTKIHKILCLQYPHQEEKITQDLDYQFSKRYLLFNHDQASKNNEDDEGQSIYLPGCECHFQPDGTLYTRDQSQPIDHILRQDCTKKFDWDAYYNSMGYNTSKPLIVIESKPQTKPTFTPQPVVIRPTPKRAFLIPIISIQQDDLAQVHRVYNGKVHHYTTNLGEVQCLLDLGWTYEQPAFECFQSYKEGRFEVFRLYNPNDPFGNHLLTINEYERDQLVSLGWILEGSNGFVEINHNMKRIYNPGTGEHFYTESDEEVQGALVAGWQLDGTVW